MTEAESTAIIKCEEVTTSAVSAHINYNKYLVGIYAGMLALLAYLPVQEPLPCMPLILAGCYVSGILCILFGAIATFSEVVIRRREAEYCLKELCWMVHGMPLPLTKTVHAGIGFYYCSILSIMLFCIFLLGLASYLIFPLVS